MRAHLADHAAAAGRIDELLPDAGYLLAADPARLLPALNHARTTQARRIDAVYRRCADHLRSGSRQMRGSYLDELEACRAGLPASTRSMSRLPARLHPVTAATT